MTGSDPVILAGYGAQLNEEHVVNVLIRFSIPHPDLTYYQKKTTFTTTELLKHQKMLYALEMKSFYIVFFLNNLCGCIIREPKKI